MELKDLKTPFAESDIEWRIQSSGIKNDKPWGMCLAYVTNRAIMDRLDKVCGPENWRNEFMPGPVGGVMCGISIKIDDEWVTKWDGAEETQVEKIKGGFSASMKRTAVQWGIGRYLYNLDSGWAVFSGKGKHSAKIKDGKGGEQWHKWDAPALPQWALPEGHKPEKKAKQEQQAPPVPNDKPWKDTVRGDKCTEYNDLADKCQSSADLTEWWDQNNVKANIELGDYWFDRHKKYVADIGKILKETEGKLEEKGK